MSVVRILDYESNDKTEESDQDKEESGTSGNRHDEQRNLWGGKGN